MQMDPEGIAPEDLSHAGSVVDKAIESSRFPSPLPCWAGRLGC